MFCALTHGSFTYIMFAVWRLTLFLKEWALIGSSAASEQLLRMMKTRMRLVKM